MFTHHAFDRSSQFCFITSVRDLFFFQVVRDIIYANARQKMGDYLQTKYPQLATTTEVFFVGCTFVQCKYCLYRNWMFTFFGFVPWLQGRIIQMFITVVFACVVSSPGNEVRFPRHLYHDVRGSWLSDMSHGLNFNLICFFIYDNIMIQIFCLFCWIG